ncbi:MAG: histidine phosphatase family protein [Acidimicrobiia bacterium]|nr:histidine phosphatase family protein [Acidimicrobiia bacterium]
MPARVTFIRHAQTDGNAAGRWQGHTNSSLTEKGRGQAARLAERLADTPFDLVVASDLDRTVETAGALGRPLETDERWREPYFGDWEDLTTAEIAADGTGGLAALMAGEDVSLGGGERLSEVFLRANEALRDLVARLDGDGSAAVVSHGMTLLTLFSALLGTHRPSPLRLLGNAAIADLVFEEDRIWTPRYNDDTHLGNTPKPFFGQDPSDTQVFLIRHGQTDSNTQSRWQGHQDGHLNGEGSRQAELLAAHLPQLSAIYASPLVRAADTARAIGDAQGLEVTDDERLKEISFGAWEGLTRAEIMDRFPEQASEFFAGIDVPRGGTGETFDQVRDRMRRSLAEIAAQHPGETIGVVSHGGATRAWVTEVLGLSYEDRSKLTILGNTGYARIIFGRRRPSLYSWNMAPHLEKD